MAYSQEVADKRFEIYGLIDPRDASLRYIGKANNTEKRFAGHMRDSRRRQTPVYAWIRKLQGIGLQPDWIILSICSDWKAEERRLISSARRQGIKLLNVADGGDEPFCSPAVGSRNGSIGAAERERDPCLYARHRLLQSAGFMISGYRRAGDHDRADKLQSIQTKLRSLPVEELILRMLASPGMVKYFPIRLQQEIREIQHA